MAERLANAIGETGLTVWWDRHIKGGAEFSRDIEQQLDAATRVLVLWSKEAVDSRWVRDEASVAADSGRLVSATIDGTAPPLGFRQFQTVDLKAWAVKGAAIPAELAEALEVEPDAPRSTAGKPPRRQRSRLVAASLALLLLAGAATVAIVRPGPFDDFLSGDNQGDGLALAIMPFDTPDGASNFLGAGLASALAESLSPLSGLKITAATSTQALAGKGLTAPDIARKLGVTHLVEGNVARVAEGYAISVRLVEAKGSEQIWTRSFQGGAAQLQELKSRMARDLAGALRARLGVGQGALADGSDVDPEAYEAYLRALERLSVRDRREARLEALKQFRLAASIDPDFADAHAGHAYLLALSTPDQLGRPWPQLQAEQRRANERALELDPDNDLALVARSTAFKNFHGAVDKALAIDRLVIKRSPNFAQAHYSIGASLWMSGRAREALDHLDLAIERDPFDGPLRFYRAKILLSLGDYEGVRAAAKECGDGCGGLNFIWFLAMCGFATPAQVEADLEAVGQGARRDGVPAEIWADAVGIIRALATGRAYTPRPFLADDALEFVDAAMAARLIGFAEGLRIARSAADLHQADYVLDILNDGRLTFTAEQRADPRYHALFRHPKLVNIAAARRKQGVTAGLPVFPMKNYTGR